MYFPEEYLNFTYFSFRMEFNDKKNHYFHIPNHLILLASNYLINLEVEVLKEKINVSSPEKKKINTIFLV